MSTNSYKQARKTEPTNAISDRTSWSQSRRPKADKGRFAASTDVASGLMDRRVLLASEDIDQYALHLSRFHAEYLPITDAEGEVVQAIADCEWRLRRNFELQAGIYGFGERQFAECFPGEPEDVRKALIKVQTHLTYHQQLSSLSTQEVRLERQKAKAIEAFERLKRDRPQTPAGMAVSQACEKLSASAGAAASAIGFEFSDVSGACELASFLPLRRSYPPRYNWV